MDAMEDGFSWENPHFPTEVTHDHTAKRKGREEKVLEVLEEPKKKKLMKDQKGKSVKVEEEEEEDKGKLWKDDEIEILIALHGEMDKEFLRNSKKQGTSYILTLSVLSRQRVLQCNFWLVVNEVST